MVELFLDGGPFMYPILLLLLGGLALVVERFRSLSQSQANSDEFMKDLSKAVKTGGSKGGMAVCKGHDGPVSNICKAGLDKAGKGADRVEKAIENAGSLEMAFLEKNMGWLTAIVAIAPMMGFTGTVWGMIGAFEAIEAANDISPAVVAGGISQALLTTAFGLVVAMIIQICQNFFSSQIDEMVLDMEEKSIELTDLLRSAK
jgi:biopolymer transport protein ExbB